MEKAFERSYPGCDVQYYDHQNLIHEQKNQGELLLQVGNC